MNKDRYLEFVIRKAAERGKLFFLDVGEGNDYFDEDRQWYIEDLSGWLINPADKERFINSKKKNTVYDEFSDSYVFVKWGKSQNKEIQLTFQYY